VILDSSALIAILTGEPDRDELIAAVTADNIRLMSAVSLVEAGIVLAARYGAAGGTDLDNWLDTAGVTIEPLDAHQATVARTAWLILVEQSTGKIDRRQINTQTASKRRSVFCVHRWTT